MIDYFALLKQQRRPWLEPDALKDTFLTLSSELHPDRIHSASAMEKERAQEVYIDLNAAYQCLREPKARLRHLLELERGKLEQVQSIPSAMMNLSLEVAQACREADLFLSKKAKATSPLLQVELFERGQEHVQTLTWVVKQLESRRELLMTELMQVDSIWVQRTAGRETGQLDRIEEIYRLLSYYERWSGHLRERIVQLSL